ncbi:MAG TPA: nitrogen fixation negative regulator NifL [Gammaproteobacteria bacterium]
MTRPGLPLTEKSRELEGLGLPAHLFQAAVEQSPVAISITDLRANILYTNPAFQCVTGYEFCDVTGHNESLLSDKRTPPQVYHTMWQSLVAQRPWSGILINRRKDGTPYLAELNVAPVLDAQGLTTHYLGMHRDVTEIHRLQSRLGNHRQLIESVINAAPLVVALVDENGGVVLKNPAYLSLMEALAGIEPARLLLGNAELTAESFGDREIRLDTPGGAEPRWFVCSATRVHERDEEADSFFAQQGHQYLLLVAKEITELKRQQEQMRVNSLRALVAEQEKLGTLRETISAAIFQLQGPLNMLTAAMGMESRRVGERPERFSPLFNALHTAIEAGNKAITVLQGSLPQLVDEPLVSLNINQVLRDALGITTERLLAGGIVIDWRPAPILPAICGYENQLRAMFKQLIDNAIDALDGQSPRERALFLSSALRDGEVCITLEDSGSGIAEEHLLKVFEPFFTTRRGGDHTGMGLAMVQETVNRHAGVLSLSNREEGGCRVLICLPVNAPQLCETQSQELS